MLPYSAIFYSNSEMEWKKEFLAEPPEEKEDDDHSLFHLLWRFSCRLICYMFS